MSWSDVMVHVSATTAKVDRVLVFDAAGNPVAVTAGVETSQTEGQAVVNSLLDSTMLLTKLHVDGDSFCCIQGAEHNIVGRGIKHRELVIAGVRDGDHSVVFIGTSAGKGSFIFELQDTLSLRAQGKLLPQLQQQQQEKELQQQQDHLAQGGDSSGGAVADASQVLVNIS